MLDTTQYITTATYDALNRGTSLLLPSDIDGHRALIESVFNRAGALLKIKKDSGEYVKEIAYNAKGQQILAAWKNGIMMRFVHDPKTFRLSRVKAEGYSVTDSGNIHQYSYQSGTTRYDQSYVYDLMGNITEVMDCTPDCGIQNSTDQLNRIFEYDALYRLIYANGREMNTRADTYMFADAPTIGNPSASNCRYYEQEYVYDKVGNIQQLKHRVIGNSSLYYTRAFSYEIGNNKLTQVGSLSDPDSYAGNITYDNAGNTLTTNSDRAYLWNYANQMKTFSLLSGSGSLSIHANYLYDASGGRVKKFVLYASGQYESKVYIDGVYEEYKKGSSLGVNEHRNYLYLPGGIEYKTGALDDVTESRDKYMITDYLGSAVIQLDHNGALYDTEEYYPYGDSSLRAWGKKRYRYINKEKDDESGLYQMGARYLCLMDVQILECGPDGGEKCARILLLLRTLQSHLLQ